ncbi:MAG: hypothetical protein JWM16_2797 [Verrucomicrobiales bacterium]|nr:hypothetical protein [Verrucomicrobiales bacterium]
MLVMIALKAINFSVKEKDEASPLNRFQWARWMPSFSV